MKLLLLIALVGILALPGHARAQSTFDIYLWESGGNVLASGSGTIDTTDLIDDGLASGSGFIRPSNRLIAVGPSSSASVLTYGGISGPDAFGIGGPTLATSGSGEVVAVNAKVPAIFVPNGYISGSELSDTAIWDTATFSSLGVTSGTYTWTWGSGADAGSFILHAGEEPVPEPSQYGLGIFLAAAAFIAWRRFSVHAA